MSKKSEPIGKLPSRLQPWLLFAGGVDQEAAKDASRVEVYSYMRDGAMLHASAGFMTLVTILAMHVALRNWIGAVVVGLLLGCVLFSIDNAILGAEARRDGGGALAAKEWKGWGAEPQRFAHARLGIRLVLSVLLCSFNVGVGEQIFYEAEIKAEMVREHVARTAPLRVPAAARVDRRTAEAAAAAARAAQTRDRLRGLLTGLSDPFDAARFDAEAAAIGAEIEQSVAVLAQLRQAGLQADQRKAAEVGGLKLDALSSGVAGQGPLFRAAETARGDADQRAQQMQVQIAELRRRAADVEGRRAAAQVAAQEGNAQQRRIVAQDLAAADRQARASQDRLDGMRRERERLIAEAIRNDPAYVPMSDGLLARADALHNLLAASAPAMTLSWLAKIAVVLLETMAVMLACMVRKPGEIGARMVLRSDRAIRRAILAHRDAGDLEKRLLAQEAELIQSKLDVERLRGSLLAAKAVSKVLNDGPVDPAAAAKIVP